jgi:hypothetical protein
VHDDVGVSSHYLLFRCEFGTLFEFEVPNGAGQSEVSIDSAKVDKPTGRGNSSFFAFILRLMVKGERLGPALDS